MDDQTVATYVIIYVFGLIAFLATSYFFWRWIFSIKRQLWNQKQQINLLIKIAEKLGTEWKNEAALDEIKRQNNNPSDSQLK